LNVQPAQISMVNISDILSPPVSCAISTHSNMEKFAELAKTSSESLPIIKLGRTDDGKLYAINHHDVILGCKRAGPSVISKIHAIIIEEFAGSPDVLVAHFREIIGNESLNTVSIYDAINYIQEKLQVDKKEALKLLWLHDTPYEKLILSKMNNYISYHSIEKLQGIVDKLSERKNIIPSQIAVPSYVLSKISRIQQEREQLQLISEIQVDLETMPDGKFSWTTPEQIDTMIKFNRQEAAREENNREKSVIAISTRTKDVGKPSEKTKTTENNNHSDNSQKNKSQSRDALVDRDTKMVQKSIPNMIIIPDEKTGKPDLLVNKKTGAVSKIEPSENKDIIKTASVGSKQLYSIPIDVASHLELDDSNNITRHKNFDHIPNLEKFLKTFPKDGPVKLSLFWSVA